ncbi:MAG: recombinase family protein [Oscillospiraceae bacterium]|nr:recombinase family protein [Oscillospiraceae bacterium]
MQKSDFERENRGSVYRTAIYLRLSRDDGDKAESDSIANQRKLLEDYLFGRSEFRLVGEYVDDGYSGSSFERPAWKRLYEDLESGTVNCIIVKDLSRFGRNYIEVGRYLQMIFPVLGVRLVAINDNFDTLNEWQGGDSLTVPMKNLINDIYCKDISKKVTTQLDAMRRRGEFVSNFAPYGYKKDPENRSKLIVDENVAGIVKQIFIWKLEGYSDNIIADMLNEQGVPSPYEYHLSQGNRVSGNFKKFEKARWARGIVYNILHNECYTGTMVQGKRRKVSYRSKEIIILPKEEWTRVPGTHEPIVDRELFELVQEIMKKDTRIAGGKTKVELLSGFLFCAECHRQLVIQSTYCNGRKYRYYTCKSCRDEGRKTKRVSESKAESAILEAIRNMAEVAVRMEKIIGEADHVPAKSSEVTRIDAGLIKLQDESERYSRLKSGLYEDFLSGILSREEYNDYNRLFSEKIDMAKAELRRVTDERRRIVDSYKDMKWIKTFKKYRGITSLERPILAELVEEVLVHENKQLDIVFRYQNSIDAALEAYGYGEGDYGDEIRKAI